MPSKNCRYIEKYNIPYKKRIPGVTKYCDKHGKLIYDQNLFKSSFESKKKIRKILEKISYKCFSKIIYIQFIC